MESEGQDTKHTSSRLAMPMSQTMKAAFQTVANYPSGDKAKEMFGFRRSTFQNTNSVLSDAKGGGPSMLGLDRKQNEVTPSNSNSKPNNQDIAQEED